VELDVAEARFADFGGMEYPELVRAVDDDSSLYHEIAHQWFYGLVGSDQYREPWLDESMATFANRRLDRSLRGCATRKPLRQFPGVRLTASMAFWDRRPMDYAAVYDGGACALESLRRGIGPVRFGTLLRTWVARHRMQVATTADFVALVRELAPRSFNVNGWLRRSRIGV
jgi:aminopeptidase N